ncbi:hypothetical protein V6N12_024237 [Hibiscus sabdariffa]|uniref:Uncharacterized protein n=1 Tax=Hibiscus sabdariffa TaxID=183260 RepID=A0ABR2G0Y4_9ROSI
MEDDSDLESRPPKHSYSSAASGSTQVTVSVPKPTPESNYNPEIARGGTTYEKSRGRDCYKRIEKDM